MTSVCCHIICTGTVFSVTMTTLCEQNNLSSQPPVDTVGVK